MFERTFVMIKPDGVEKGLVDEIIRRIQRGGLKITSMRGMKLTRELAERLYEPHRGKDFFAPYIEYMLSGEVVVMLVEGERAISCMRELAGPTNPAEAPKGTIRGDYGTIERTTGIYINVIHASDSAKEAERELRLFFKE
jgi:nucleoside-diphosphate kinase